MKLWELLKSGEEALREAGVEEYQSDAFILFEYALGINRGSFILRKMDLAAPEEIEKFNGLISKRKERIPVQYITGSQVFMGLEFSVNENVLIPRFDTEVLVSEVMNRTKDLEEGFSLLDMCTGSGCIGISLARLCKNRPLVTGVDISDKALQLASENARTNETEVEFIQSNLFENVEGIFDVIVSNPPYIRPEVIEGLSSEVKDHEPMLALAGTLDGDTSGVEFYRRIVNNSSSHLRKGGLLFFEIGYDQGEEVRNIMANEGYRDIEIIKDLAGLDRVIWGRYC